MWLCASYPERASYPVLVSVARHHHQFILKSKVFQEADFSQGNQGEVHLALEAPQMWVRATADVSEGFKLHGIRLFMRAVEGMQ
jgi:hypothetical protein